MNKTTGRHDLKLGRRGLLGGAAALLLAPPRPAHAAMAAVPSRADLVHSAGVVVEDLLRNFWEGPADSGHIRPTHGGWTQQVQPLPDPRGAMWERGMMYNALFEYHNLTSEADMARRLAADWHWVSRVFSEQDLTQCGRSSHANWASDDTGWDVLTYLQAHAITGDESALRYAALSARNAYERWHDETLGGGVWYNDARAFKSLYETALALGALDAGTQMSDAKLRHEAIESGRWIHEALHRTDDLYWCETTLAGPVGLNRADAIRAGGSVTYLGGDMGISVLQIRLAATLGKPALRDDAISTARAVAHRMVDGDGVLIDDRDGWNDGYFAAMWAREVVPASGTVVADALRRTGGAIATRDRFADGFLGPDWDGPNPDSRWPASRTQPRQLMTTATAATIVIAAASLA